MSNPNLIYKRPSGGSFKNGVALHDIYDEEGIKWIAKGQKLSARQISTALAKGSLTKRDKSQPLLAPSLQSKTDLKPTFDDINELTERLEHMQAARDQDLTDSQRLSRKTQTLVQESADSIMELLNCNRFSPYKLTGLTHFLYGEERFKHRREPLKMLNNTGTQFTLFQGIMDGGIKDIVVANLLNPQAYISQLTIAKSAGAKTIDKDRYRAYCEKASKTLVKAVQKTPLGSGLTMDLLRYFSPHLYFTSAEARLYQLVNTYIDFLMPAVVKEAVPFTLSAVPVVNFAHYFKHRYKGNGLGVEGTRIVQYVGLLPPGTAIQFTNREKGIIIAPKNNDLLYCVIITGMDGQPLMTPSLREVHFRDLNQAFKIIASQELPLKYETHSHEKIWKMHIVHENLKKLGS